jgi:hypothetical protein
MQTFRRFFAVLLVLFLAYVALSQNPMERVPLPFAVANRQANVTIRGTGGSSGDAIKVDVGKGPQAGPGPLTISVPPGTVLNNGNGGGQNMAIAGVVGREISEYSYTPASDIVVTESNPVTYVLSAFCINFEKENPSTTDEFTVGQTDPVLACILGGSKNFSVPTRQAAVWIYTDNVSYQHMSEKFPVSPQEYEQGRTLANQCR